MRIYITGGAGQLGRALQTHLASDYPDIAVTTSDLPEVDITDRTAITAALRAAAPDVVLHCAAYTNVDGAAKDPTAAFRVNGMGTQNVALAAAELGTALLYVSTNEVFDGEASRPYDEFAVTNPINAYGASKRAGEWYTRSLTQRFYIVRTSWLYARGGRNFIHRIQELADKHGLLRVVTDEVAHPTAVDDLAEAVVRLILTGQYGIYHLVNEGAVSRFDFAAEILRQTGRTNVPMQRITRAEFERASTPPANTALANNAAAALGITMRPWQDALATYIAEYGRVA